MKKCAECEIHADCCGQPCPEHEEVQFLAEVKTTLRTATPKDFQIVDSGSESFPYAASLHGHTDIAKFKRKADAEAFTKTFPRKR